MHPTFVCKTSLPRLFWPWRPNVGFENPTYGLSSDGLYCLKGRLKACCTAKVLIQTQCAAQLRQIFGQRVNRRLQCFAVGLGEFVVGFKAVGGLVFGQNLVNGFEIGIGFVQQRLIFFGNQRAEQIDDFFVRL